MEPKYVPKKMYFLRVTPRGDETIEILSFDLSRLKNKTFPFGEFNNYISSPYGIEPEYAIVEFFPKSRDVHLFPEEYETCKQALDAAIRHLKKEGLDAAPVELEALINRTSLRSFFYK